jgi:hypothetical protein
MPKLWGSKRWVPACAVVLVILVGCGHPSPPSSDAGTITTLPQGTTSSSNGSPLPAESPVPAESNPPGDIPDNTQFVQYRSSAGGFVVKVPEGWSRRNTSSSVSFTDKLNTVRAEWYAASSEPTTASARSQDVPDLRTSERAFVLSRVIACSPSCSIPYSTAPISVTLHAGNAVVITYQANSSPNSVTGKQYRLEELRFEFYRNGQVVALTLSGPVGSDNVDPWRLVSESFGWL